MNSNNRDQIKNLNSPEEVQNDLLRNRYNAEDRPYRSKQLRDGIKSLAMIHCTKGYNVIFRPFDNYGCCKDCGYESLT